MHPYVASYRYTKTALTSFLPRLRPLVLSSLLLYAGAGRAKTAENPAAPRELTELIQKALSSNAELKALEASRSAASARVGPAGSWEDPMLAVEAMNIPTDTLRFNQYEMSGLQISLAQKFPFPGKLSGQREVADLKSQTIDLRLKQMRLEITWNIKRIYYELYLKFQKKASIANQRTYLQQTLETSRSRYTLGQVSQVSILNLQVEEARLLNEQLRLSSEMKNLEAELAHIGGHGEHAIPLVFQTLTVDRVNLHRWTEESIAQKVIAQNIEIQALQSEVKMSDASLKLARKSYLPDFEFMASYTKRDPIPGMDPPDRGQDFIGAKIGVSLPLWGGIKQSEQIKEAAAEKDRASFELENARLMQLHQARALFAELRESSQRIDLFEGGLLQLSRQAVAASKSSYLTGKAEYTVLLDTLTRLQETEYSYQEALVSYQVQMAKLEALLGQSLGAS